MNGMPVRNFLESLRGKRVFFDPLQGNHGDRLLTLAASAMLQQAGFTLAAKPESADFILLNGGGSMVAGWSGLKRLASYSKKFPLLPLAVLPSSFDLNDTGLADICRNRQAPMWLWARERPSLAVLEAALAGGKAFRSEVFLGLDHDLAFSLAQHPLVSQLGSTPPGNIVLIVERDDWEGPTGRRRPFSPPGLEFIPEKLRSMVRKSLLGPLRNRQDRRSPLPAAALRFVCQACPEYSTLTPLVGDISLAETCSFEDFLHHVARSSVIVTTRLHVAILGHLLKRRTYLVEGSYHKFRGVFEYSMQPGSSRLLEWNCQELELQEHG